MAREYQNGDGFGYILAFKKKDTSSWSEVKIPHVESSRYVYFNESLTPYSPFEVKIKAFNRRGEGPFSQTAAVHSAEEGESLGCLTIHHFSSLPLQQLVPTCCVLVFLLQSRAESAV